MIRRALRRKVYTTDSDGVCQDKEGDPRLGDEARKIAAKSSLEVRGGAAVRGELHRAQ